MLLGDFGQPEDTKHRRQAHMWVASEVGRSIGGAERGRLAAGGPQEPDHAHLLASRTLQRPADVLGRQPPGDLTATTGELAAHGVDMRDEAGYSFQPDDVLGWAGPIELTVGEPTDEVPHDQFLDSDVDLGCPDVVSAR